MRNAVTLLSLVVAVVAEAPYHLPRPAPLAPVLNYSPLPATLPQPPAQVIHQQSQQSLSGYSYPRPSRPFIIQNAPAPQHISVPQPIYQQQPAYQPLPIYQPQPVYQPQPAPQPQPIYNPLPAPLPVYHPQPAPQPLPIYQPQPAPQPLPIYQPQPAPQPLPTYQPQPLPQIPVFQPQPIPIQPSTSYGVPHTIRPLSTISISQPQTFQQQIPIQYYQQQQNNQGFSYQQSLPILSSSNQNTALSSYQADSVQYSNAQQGPTRLDALDDSVVSRVQSIIKDNEHSTAKDRGYLSLVSGVTLENAKPSVEVLSFVHNSPLSVDLSQSSQTLSQNLGSSSISSSSSSSSSYDFGTNVQSGGSDSSAFLPQSKPATAYGVPN